MIIDLLNKKLRPITVRRLGNIDHEELFSLHCDNAFYNSCLQKEKVTMQQVLDGLAALPPNTTAEQKFYVGFFVDGWSREELCGAGQINVGILGEKICEKTKSAGEFTDKKEKNNSCAKLFGCMDYIEGYPDGCTVFVGLFMLATSLHKQSLGSRIINALEMSVRESGYKKIRLACLENNTIAYSFWKKLGFSDSEIKDFEGKRVIIMEKGL